MNFCSDNEPGNDKTTKLTTDALWLKKLSILHELQSCCYPVKFAMWSFLAAEIP